MNEGEEIKAISLPEVLRKADQLKTEIQALIYKFTRETTLNIEVEIQNDCIEGYSEMNKRYMYRIKTTVIL